jgi:hypothetical protein
MCAATWGPPTWPPGSAAPEGPAGPRGAGPGEGCWPPTPGHLQVEHLRRHHSSCPTMAHAGVFPGISVAVRMAGMGPTAVLAGKLRDAACRCGAVVSSGGAMSAVLRISVGPWLHGSHQSWRVGVPGQVEQQVLLQLGSSIVVCMHTPGLGALCKQLCARLRVGCGL